MAEQSSRQKVENLYKLGKGKNAAEIAEELSMSVANVYAHIRKINAEHGIASRGRGRPPKVQTDGEKTESKTKEAPKASRPAPGKSATKSAPKSAPASTNGHDEGEYPNLIEALDRDLAKARNRVTKLEKMREALVG